MMTSKIPSPHILSGRAWNGAHRDGCVIVHLHQLSKGASELTWADIEKDQFGGCGGKMVGIEDRVRQEVLQGKGDDLRGLLLTHTQVEMVRNIAKSGEMTAGKLALELNVSVQNASAKLNRLAVAGYLERTSTTALSGGLEYVYRVPEGMLESECGADSNTD